MSGTNDVLMALMTNSLQNLEFQQDNRMLLVLCFSHWFCTGNLPLSDHEFRHAMVYCSRFSHRWEDPQNLRCKVSSRVRIRTHGCILPLWVVVALIVRTRLGRNNEMPYFSIY